MIYFIQGATTKKIKIGRTRNSVHERLQALQVGSPDILKILLVVEGGKNKEEPMIRSLLKKSRSHGEWFNPTKEVVSLINKIRRNKKIKLSKYLKHIGNGATNMARFDYKKGF